MNTKEQELEALKRQVAAIEKELMEERKNNPFSKFQPRKESILEVLEYLEENNEYAKNLGFKYGFSRCDFSYEGTKITVPGWGLSLHHREGGEEGCGEEHWIVIKVTDLTSGEDTYWRVPGYYQSYNGSELEWDDMYQVEPYEKTVIDYRKI